MRTSHILFMLCVILSACSARREAETDSATSEKRIPILIDSDANNELDDQHAIAYALANQQTFDIQGITVNNTRFGDGIDGQYEEALRVLRLFNEEKNIPLYKGAVGSYSDIVAQVTDKTFDGSEAVNFIVEQARKERSQKLVLVPIGKLTNIALAIAKAPDIIPKVRVVWLGSNFPEAGEYNLENDTTAINPVLESGVEFEMVVVRYGKGTGSHEVSVSLDQIGQKMKGKGPRASIPVTGRHGGEFHTFGDYSVDLFSHIELHGDPPSRALYDMVALAIIKNPAWGSKTKMPPSRLVGFEWQPSSVELPNTWIWEEFDKDPMLADFFESIDRSTR